MEVIFCTLNQEENVANKFKMLQKEKGNTSLFAAPHKAYTH